jgi:putative heme-binding domain-containing protein
MRSENPVPATTPTWHAARCLALLTLVLSWTALSSPWPCEAQAKRVAWTTSRVQGSPEPPPLAVAERIRPEVKFKDPLELASTPSLPHLFVLEQSGKLFSLKLSDPSAKPDLALDLKARIPQLGSAYGMSFHPGFATNRQLFVCYTLNRDVPDGTRVSRFRLPTLTPPTVDPASEEIILTFPSGGHNGGSLQFGADGMLYISTGDQASPSPPDPLTTGQDISDLLSSILRIDVSTAEGSRPYRIPSDNPFLNTPNARPEVWAYGLRNPWRMSFEPGTSVLWVADVGWELWESVFRLDRPGMNCGWSIVEGSQKVRTDQKRGPTPVEKPIVAHSHEEAASITGGYFYRGARLPELRGAYVYGDWETGRMWALRHDQGRLTERVEIASTGLKLVAFGEAADQELYFLDYVGGGLYALARNPAAQSKDPFPKRLSETGLFSSVKDQVPASGVYEFNVASPLWTDGATARRWIGLPSLQPVRFTTSYWQAPRDLVPTNTVLARTVTIETRRSDPQTRRHLETQVLHFNGLSWNAYTYRWNEDQTDAVLVPAVGAQQTLSIEGERLPAGKETLNWRHHSRSECLRCHNPWNGTLLGFNPSQLSRAVPPTSTSPEFDTEAKRLSALGLLTLTEPIQASAVNPHDSTHALPDRARSYLHAQCGHCHRDNAGGAVLVKLNLEPSLADLSLVHARPVQGHLGLTNAPLLSPGDPLNSLLLYRFAKLGSSHMPYLGSSLVDETGLNLLARWIQEMPGSNLVSHHPHLLSAARTVLPQLGSADTNSHRQFAGLIQSPQGALALRLAIAERSSPTALDQGILNLAQNAESPLMRDLLAPLLPAHARRQVIGNEPDVEALVALPGSSERGKGLFSSSAGPQCQNCHTAQGAGKAIGPDLSQVAKKYTKDQILRHILEPNLWIDPAYATWTAEATDGESYTGCLVQESPDQIVLKDATGNLHSLPRSKVRSLLKSGTSLMPEGLLSQSTAEEVADLLAYLAALRGE